MNVVFCCSEVFPFAKTGGLADVCGALPPALQRQGIKVGVMMPRYGCLDGTDLQPMGEGIVRAALTSEVPLYCVEHDGFFRRDGIYGDQEGDYPDSLKRFAYFNRRVLDFLMRQGAPVDILHCHDWQAALIPVYVRHHPRYQRFFARTRTVMTIHNLAYQGLFPKETFGDVELDLDVLQQAGFYFYGKISLLRAGLVSADLVTTVSPHYAREICTPEQGCGMDDVLCRRQEGIIGILNGVDDEVWDPAHDPVIEQTFSADRLSRRRANKTALQKISGLDPDGKAPLFGFVGRLSHQKGIEAICDGAEQIVREGGQIVLLGVGDPGSEARVREAAARYPRRVAAHILFDEALAHRIYAGSDFFLMPSVFEPCGLSQMISLRYGAVPIVSASGGLVDTVDDYAEGGVGIVIPPDTAGGFAAATSRAWELYHDETALRAVQARGMARDFSWNRSARHYHAVYERLVAGGEK